MSILCNFGLHSWTYWSMGTSTKWEGMKPKEVSHQERHCARCGWTEIIIVEPKVK